MTGRRQRAGSNLPAGERGTWQKKWSGCLPVALIFPSSYALGNSNLGFQLVYDLVNSIPDLVCERFFYEPGRSPLSCESGRPLRDFPVLLCSLSFEQDFPNLLALLLAGGVEVSAAQRSLAPHFGPGHPLIIGGGVATFINPEPLAPFIDLFVAGEAEPILPELLNRLLETLFKIAPKDLLYTLATELPGCYVPGLYRMEYNADGILDAIIPETGIPKRVRRLVQSQPDCAGYSRILSPAAEFANLFLTELGRGCSRGCRFCAAGFVYRPPRLWGVESILAALDRIPEGILRVGLLGMEMARGEDLARIADHLLSNGCTLSFSSLRADAITPELCALLGQSRLKSAAIAPDGGSERLRRVINKGISEDDVLAAAEALIGAGIMHLKLYFMIGLPTETDEDMEELLTLVRKIRDLLLAIGRSRGRLSTLSLSVNSFVPKAWTPFQFHPFAEPKALKRRIAILRKGVAGMANTRLMADQPSSAFDQAVLARGDRRIGQAMGHMVGRGLSWRQAMTESGITLEDYALRQRGRTELFPWEIIDQGIRKDYLWAEYRRGLAGRATAPCNTATCRRCGVCGER